MFHLKCKIKLGKFLQSVWNCEGQSFPFFKNWANPVRNWATFCCSRLVGEKDNLHKANHVFGQSFVFFFFLVWRVLVFPGKIVTPLERTFGIFRQYYCSFGQVCTSPNRTGFSKLALVKILLGTLLIVIKLTCLKP